MPTVWCSAPSSAPTPPPISGPPSRMPARRAPLRNRTSAKFPEDDSPFWRHLCYRNGASVTPKQRAAQLLGDLAERVSLGERVGDCFAAVGAHEVSWSARLVTHRVVDERADFLAVERLAFQQRARDGLQAGAVLAEH